MSKLRVVPYRELRKVVEAKGFRFARSVGSHHTFRNADGRIITLADHGPRDVSRPLLRKILRDMNLDRDEYHRLLDEI